jgi:hypothetical protein
MSVIPNEGEVKLLEYMLNVTPAEDQILKLFNNDVTPDLSTTIGDLTEPSTTTGYGDITLVPGDWTISTVDEVTTAEQPTQTFTFTETETIYGYYVVNDAQDTLLWIQRADFAPSTFPSIGGVYDVVPKLRITSCE